MSNKKVESIEDYVNSTKKPKKSIYDDYLFIEPISMLPIDGLSLAWFTLIILAAGIIGAVILCCY
jgi:hypothetical protein